MNMLNFTENRLCHRYFDYRKLTGNFRYKSSLENHGTDTFDSSFNDLLMLRQLTDLNFKWKELIQLMPSLRATRKIFPLNVKKCVESTYRDTF